MVSQWRVDAGATGQVYVATQAGNYTVVVTDGNGCTATSLPSFTTSLSDAPDGSTLVVYPNPVSDKLYFELPQPIQSTAIVNVYDIIGKLIHTEEIDASTKFINFNFAAGTYHIEMVVDDVIYRNKVVK
ncbi:MAG: T9SS type A sorting domain-containing protein [Bacteroidetes bacterium]|nr:T9SS type A sorting domain-containing protein [Bacteroidota bacterium]